MNDVTPIGRRIIVEVKAVEEKTKSGIAAASDSVAEMKSLYAEIHAAEQASLDKIKSEEKSADSETGPIS